MSAVHAWALPEFDNFGMVREQPAVDGQSVATVTSKVPYVLRLEPSLLQLLTMHYVGCELCRSPFGRT